jgi:hypothetical protein
LTRSVARGHLPGAGFSDNLINEIKWDGVSLDSQVSVKYGAWVRQTFEAKNLVSLNADVYFRLKSDYAKSFWPFIDSQPTYTYFDDVTLAELAGRHYRAEDSKKRAKFREDVVQAFNDMVSPGGLSEWRCEVLGSGRLKTYRWNSPGNRVGNEAVPGGRTKHCFLTDAWSPTAEAGHGLARLAHHASRHSPSGASEIFARPWMRM